MEFRIFANPNEIIPLYHYESFNQRLKSYGNMVDLKTYEKINEEIKFTEEETVELLKLSEKEILVLILSELKKITANTEK